MGYQVIKKLWIIRTSRSKLKYVKTLQPSPLLMHVVTRRLLEHPCLKTGLTTKFYGCICVLDLASTAC